MTSPARDARRRRSWTGDDCIGVGLILLVFGGLIGGGVLVAEQMVGLLLLAAFGVAGGTVLLVGIVAKGVEVGMREVKR